MALFEGLAVELAAEIGASAGINGRGVIRGGVWGQGLGVDGI